MIVFTKPGDTPEALAERYLGCVDASYASQIKAANYNSFAWQTMCGCGVYAPNRAVWLPEEDDIHDDERDEVIRAFDWIPSYHRENLVRAQDMGIDLYTLLGAYSLTATANTHTSDANIGLVGAAFAYNTADRVVDLKKGRMEKFTQRLGDVKEQLKAIAAMQGVELNEPGALDGYWKSYVELQEDYAQELHEFKLRNSPFLTKPLKTRNRVRKQGWQVYDKMVVRQAERMATMLKWAGRGFIVGDLAYSTAEVIEAYHEGKDWTKVVMREGTKTAISMGLVYLTELGVSVLLAMTPVGWVAIIGVAVVEAGEIMVSDHVIDRLFS